MIWSISLKIRTYLSCIVDIKQTVLTVHYPLPVFEKVSLFGHVSTFRYRSSGFMRLWASGTFSDVGRSITWSSVTARRCHWQRVAASATAQTHCVTGCVLVKMERSELEICVAFGCIDMCAFHPSVHVAWCVCVLMVSTCVYECVGGCAHVVMFRCPGWVWKPVVSVVASVTLTVSPSTQELLSHAACFCQCWAEGVTPQRFAAPCVCATDGCRWSCTCIFPAEQTAPCWLPRTVKRSVSWSD